MSRRSTLLTAAAGLTQIDHLLLTHYQVDHIGNVVQLASMVPIKNFYDHGLTSEPDREQVPGFKNPMQRFTPRRSTRC